MDIFEDILPIYAVVTLAAFLYLCFYRLARYLLFFQQEEYDSKRYVTWYKQARAFDSEASLYFIFVFLLCSPSLYDRFIAGYTESTLGMALTLTVFDFLLLPLLFIFLARGEKKRLAQAKKPLVWTARAKRIFYLALLMFIIVAASGRLLIAQDDQMIPRSLLFFVLIQILPFFLILANILLISYESSVRRHYRREAEEKLKYLSPTIVGITGSFGKTSTKHILFHILATAAPTLMTPGSVNTIMGVTRVIREQLKPEHRFFIVEMGDYAPGAVAEKCAFTPPAIGAITAVGIEHFERFKTMAAIAQTKFELAHDVWARGGVCVINGLQLAAEFRGYLTQPSLTRLITDQPDAGGFYVHDIVQTAQGLRLKISTPAKITLDIHTPLFGTQHATNIAVAAVLALELGVPASTISMALQTVPQTKHRLEVKRNNGTYTMIDDAYNSNPQGFAAALQVLDLVAKDTGGRRILITPGMVELGTLHDSEHARVGAMAATLVDWVIAVRPDRFASFKQAVQAANPRLRFDVVPSLAAARALLESAVKPADVVLFENDLPDLYEQKPNF